MLEMRGYCSPPVITFSLNESWVIILSDRGATKLLFHEDFTVHAKY